MNVLKTLTQNIPTHLTATHQNTTYNTPTHLTATQNRNHKKNIFLRITYRENDLETILTHSIEKKSFIIKDKKAIIHNKTKPFIRKHSTSNLWSNVAEDEEAAAGMGAVKKKNIRT